MADTNGGMIRRNRPGTKAQDMCKWSDEVFEEMDSTLAVQQVRAVYVEELVDWTIVVFHRKKYIQQLIRRDNTKIEDILQPPEGQDEGVWKYEHLRQFCLEFNGLAVKLQQECKPDTCTQMTATEQWIFLCAAHKTPKEVISLASSGLGVIYITRYDCPAVDYTRHTLDGAASLLNSNKYFPSRVSIKDSSVSKLGSVCRRVYRVFSHAYFHHPALFKDFENETHLCKRFTRFVTKYDLMSRDILIVPIFEDEEEDGDDEPYLLQNDANEEFGDESYS